VPSFEFGNTTSLGAAAWPSELFHHREVDFSSVIDDTISVEQPQNDRDHDNEVEDGFDHPLHGDEGVDQPKDHTNDYQSKHYGKKRHDRG
jgi:hypothetical protein